MSASRTLLHRLPRALRIRPQTQTYLPSASLSATSTRSFHATASNMVVREFKSKADFDQAVKDNKIIIIDATAVWCGPCKAISPVLEKLSDQEQFSSIVFAKFDVDNVPELTQELGVRAMPSFFVYKDGEPAGSLVGANPSALEKLVANSLA